MCPDAVQKHPALAHEKVSCAVKHRHALLLRRLDRHKAHAGPGDRFADRFRIRGVVLLPLQVWLDASGRDQPDLVPQRRDLARPAVRAGAGLQANKTGRQVPEEIEHRPASQLPTQDNGALRIHAVELKDTLGQIGPECFDLHVGGSLFCWVATAPAWHSDAVEMVPSTPSD
jgi:hypothetical protein